MIKSLTQPKFCATKDLFGDVVVTIEDVELWLDAIPCIPRTSPLRREYYAKHWDVVNKIKSYKLRGLFWDAIEVSEPDTTSRLSAVLAACSR